MNHEDTKEREVHEENLEGKEKERLTGMRLASPLSERAERAMTETIGCAIRVHRALGPGFLESIYRKAMCRPIVVTYRNVPLSGQRVDLIIEREIVVELKSIVKLDEIHRAQLISYLRSTGLRGGLLINFRVSVLKNGIRRVVL